MSFTKLPALLETVSANDPSCLRTPRQVVLSGKVSVFDVRSPAFMRQWTMVGCDLLRTTNWYHNMIEMTSVNPAPGKSPGLNNTGSNSSSRLSSSRLSSSRLNSIQDNSMPVKNKLHPISAINTYYRIPSQVLAYCERNHSRCYNLLCEEGARVCVRVPPIVHDPAGGRRCWCLS
jgi:hypothetical protein